MKRFLIVAALVVLALPATLAASPADEVNAARECKAERAAMGVDLFKAKYGTNANKSNAFGKCVSKTAKELKEQHAQDAANAAKECKAERTQLGVDAFNEKYGTNPNKKNAFGKCVSEKVKALEAEHEAQEHAELNAARKCRAERTALGVAAFNAQYGTNANKKNAFGKCVAKNAKPA